MPAQEIQHHHSTNHGTSISQSTGKNLQRDSTDEIDCKKKEKYLPPQTFTSKQMILLRFTVVLLIVLTYLNSDQLQAWINKSYDYLTQQWWFNSVYFETGLVVVYSFPAVASYQIMDKIKYFDKYRIESHSGRIQSESIPQLLVHSVIYITPLGLLDTFHVKNFHGVDNDVILEKRRNWIQRTRALPEAPPSLQEIVTHLMVAMVIYDALFFFAHLTLHSNATLYRIFHKKHHTHERITVKATDHEHWVERILFILCANGGLKIQGAHPVTRMIFVFLFVLLLLHNHSGYDFPWTLDKIVPWGLIGGSRQHYEHHASGKRNYQFMFTYLDKILEWKRKKRQQRSL